ETETETDTETDTDTATPLPHPRRSLLRRVWLPHVRRVAGHADVRAQTGQRLSAEALDAIEVVDARKGAVLLTEGGDGGGAGGADAGETDQLLHRRGVDVHLAVADRDRWRLDEGRRRRLLGLRGAHAGPGGREDGQQNRSNGHRRLL